MFTKSKLSALSPILSIAPAIALAIGAASPAAAQQQRQAPAQGQTVLINQFNDAVITQLLRDVQATWQVENGPQGVVNYTANAEGGLNFVLSPRSCSPDGGCRGLVMLALFDGLNVTNSAELDTVIHRFNDLDATAKVYRAGNDTVLLQGYMNAAYGITYDNARAQLLVFGQDIVSVSRTLTAFEETQ